MLRLLWSLALAAPAFAGDLSIPHEMYELDNGLDVILAPDHSTPIVHVELWYHVGSKDEEQGLTGFAHLFEHLMFQGSLNAPGEYFTPLQEVGARINGTTNGDRTNYYETVPAWHLPLALFMESDRMGHLLEVLDQDKLDNQRLVVRNERRQRYENPPYGEVFVDLSKMLFPEGHSYNHVTIGSHEDLENASLDDVKAFFRKWYVPNNASLVIAGDFDTATAKALVQDQFGWIPRGADPPRLVSTPLKLEESTRVEQRDDVPDHKVWLAWHSAPFFGPGDAELDIASTILCDSGDGRLVMELVKEQKLARELSCYQYSRELGSMYMFEATASEGVATDKIVSEIERMISEVVSDKPFTEDEVSAAMAQYEVGFFGRLQTVASKAGTLNRYLHYVGTPDFLQQDLDRYRTVTPAAATQALHDTLSQPRVELHILPEED